MNHNLSQVEWKLFRDHSCYDSKSFIFAVLVKGSLFNKCFLIDYTVSLSLFCFVFFFPTPNRKLHLQREISELSFHNAKLIWIVQKKFTCVMGQFRRVYFLMAVFGLSWANADLSFRWNPFRLDLFFRWLCGGFVGDQDIQFGTLKKVSHRLNK